MKELEITKQYLHSNNYTCVLYKDNKIYTSTQRGVKPLVKWLESDNDFKGCFAADKVIGKATAFLYILLGAKAVYTHVISKPALQVLNKHHIAVEYDDIVENIINRKGDGICPFESTVLDVDDTVIAYDAILCKMIEMNISI